MQRWYNGNTDIEPVVITLKKYPPVLGQPFLCDVQVRTDLYFIDQGRILFFLYQVTKYQQTVDPYPHPAIVLVYFNVYVAAFELPGFIDKIIQKLIGMTGIKCMLQTVVGIVFWGIGIPDTAGNSFMV